MYLRDSLSGYGAQMSDARPPLHVGWIAGVFICAAVSLVLLPHVAQDESCHAFADHRTIWAIPNFWNVVSNLPFAIVGVWGLWRLRSTSARVLSTGLLLTCVGSAYYHLAPSDTRLIWDRLPMTLVFMSFLAAVMAEGRSPRWEVLILSPLLVVGLGSVWWWKASGDLLPYVLVQFGPAIVMLPAFRRATGKRWLWRIAALYAAAKIAELCDLSIYSALPWSGHTWKHLLGAAAGYCIVRWFCDSSQTVIRSSGDNLTSSVVSIYNEGGSDSAV